MDTNFVICWQFLFELWNIKRMLSSSLYYLTRYATFYDCSFCLFTHLENTYAKKLYYLFSYNNFYVNKCIAIIITKFENFSIQPKNLWLNFFHVTQTLHSPSYNSPRNNFCSNLPINSKLSWKQIWKCFSLCKNVSGK